eukprot:8432720-Pyramimonas_sp.AAC.1
MVITHGNTYLQRRSFREAALPPSSATWGITGGHCGSDPFRRPPAFLEEWLVELDPLSPFSDSAVGGRPGPGDPPGDGEEPGAWSGRRGSRGASPPAPQAARMGRGAFRI